MDKVFDKWTFARFQKVLSLAFGVCMLSFTLTACGDSSDDVAGGSAEEEGIIAIKDKTVSGVSQKGPFVNGSSVQLFELNGKTYAPTGRTFPGKISNDKGEFKIAGINLESQYAFLEASGYYRNEVTGEKSAAPITLNAISDLSKRETVNINLLTHLEYERVMKLVEDGMSIAKAKKQAEQEVFAAFGIEGNFDNSEDLNIFESSEADAALLAISIILQGERSEADLSELLANFAQDIAEDGKWDDEKKKAEIADWLEQVYFSESLDEIRSHFVEWKIKVDSTYESYLAKYWWTNYGLGVCEKNRDGEIKKNANDKSVNAERSYICKENKWERASVKQMDTFGWKNGKEGDQKKGKESNLMYIYSESDGWKYFSLVDSRDNNEYKVAQIENKIWFLENLRYEKGAEKCVVDGCMEINIDGVMEKRCWAGSGESLGKECYYTWEEAMNREVSECGYGAICGIGDAAYQGVCPEGWRLPTQQELMNVVVEKLSLTYAGNLGDANPYESIFDLGRIAFLWSSSEIDRNHAYYLRIGFDLYEYDFNKRNAFSVRCVKDVE